MLRPATPLAILSSIAFVLLLLSVLSTPIIKAIPLATFKNVDFGVFGYCEPGNKCTSMQVGYATGRHFPYPSASYPNPFLIRILMNLLQTPKVFSATPMRAKISPCLPGLAPHCHRSLSFTLLPLSSPSFALR